MHEEYGWKAYQAGIFIEWREEVAKRIFQISPREHLLESVRDDISREVFHELVNSENSHITNQVQ